MQSTTLCATFKAPYLAVAHLVVVLVSHVDLERVHTCKTVKKKNLKFELLQLHLNKIIHILMKVLEDAIKPHPFP